MKRRQDTTYHRVLRVTAVVFALVLLFESGLVSESTERLALQTNMYLANAVGMYASVAPTELNTYTAELTKRERELDNREAALREREIAIGLSADDAPNTDTATYVLASILFILLVLILLNYILDYLRAREAEEMQTV
ncbi:hypothetical protein KC902_02990 [Candidatus Kaiserbacteria bacterium]|nr:hypothetical protein [Candidatus Kaiserbacteria bacterium]USN88634.1 MAG: hypothetical protein H6780_04065 [Candidatus Nomurabacteria bacterium]